MFAKPCHIINILLIHYNLFLFQYASLILYHDEEQKIVGEKSRDHEQRERREVLTTDIREFEKFYPAEE